MRLLRLVALTTAIVVCTACIAARAATAQTARPDTAVMAPIANAITAGQSGNLRLLHEQYVTSPILIDEFAPFRWFGNGALDRYFASYARMVKDTRMTGTKVRMAPPRCLYVSGASAYVLVPVTTTARAAGRPYTERGTLAFTLQKTSAGWKIATQSWVKESETFNPYAAR